MPEQGEEAESVNLEVLGDNKDGDHGKSDRIRQATTRSKRVIIIGVLVTVCIIILVIVGAWFIFTVVSDSDTEWLETIPGLNHRPSSSVRDSLIMFRANDKLSYQPWVQVIDDFLKDYKHPGSSNKSRNNLVNCDYNIHWPLPGRVCYVDVRHFQQCISEYLYGYHRGTPCIFLKIHKFPNWVPEYYDISELPKAMPLYLKNHIIQTISPEQLKTVWVSCEGETSADKEYIGPIIYSPRMGFPGYFFPYSNTEGYLSPLVAVQLQRPQTGVVINIECKLWAKNIVHDREKGIGLVHFELMID